METQYLPHLYSEECRDWGVPTKGYRCHRCFKHVEMRRHRFLTKCGPHVIYQLKRFKVERTNSNAPHKIKTKVELPNSMRLKTFYKAKGVQTEVHEYFLSAVVCHLGNNVSEGHYKCYWKNGEHVDDDCEWLELNDQHTRVRNHNDVYETLCTECYLVLYSKHVDEFL